ncbi:hypothetical protein MFLAVUS_002919 [Mucor flavus]|uniref:Uncharacterized protein n=1 Tax=Mucor flavus TaxID=439312 RepID=A0ABP9YRQ2_9FUNG
MLSRTVPITSVSPKRFVLDEANNVVLISSQGPTLKDYLPNNFNTDQPGQCLPPAPDRDFMNSDSFNKQLKSLFDTNHLQLIQSTYFGPRGPTQSTIQKSSVHRALVDCIPPKDNQRQSLDVYNLQKQLSISEYGKDFSKKDKQNVVKKFEITKEHYKCFEKTEGIELDEQVRYSEDLLFSGTDNGLVTLTETAKLDIEQVKFHLKLFNKYSMLDDIKDKK